MKHKVLNQRGIAHYVLPLVVAVLVGIIGTALVVRSHAETTNRLGFANYTTATSGGSSGGGKITAIKRPAIFTSQDSLSGIGAQYVSDIPPNGILRYSNLPGKTSFSQICYYIRVYNSPKAATQVTSANVAFGGLNSSITQQVPADADYHPVCVTSGGPNDSQPDYNVWNKSPSAYVLVYQAVAYY